LEGIVCPTVERLEYRKGREDQTSALMEAFTKMFPNLKHLTYVCEGDISDFHLISSWKRLNSLALEEEYHRLSDIQITSSTFTDFLFKLGTFNPEKFNSYLSNFFRRHQKIRHFCIDVQQLFFLPPPNVLGISKVIVDSLPDLEIITAKNFDSLPDSVELFRAKLKNLRKINI
jgi:hypothetical protein